MSLPEPYYRDDAVALYCGDCREILPKLEAASIDMVFTDPPYGHKNNDDDLIARREAALGRGEPGAARPIANDGADADELVRFLFREFARLGKRGCCCCCCCCGGGPDPQFARWSLWMDEALDFKQMIVWDKGPMGMGWHYRRSYETVLVGARRGGKHRWHAESLDVENIIRPGHNGIRKIIPSKNDHPTPKPWQLAAHFMRLHSEPGDVVLDPFCGGGSTLEAARNMGRKFIGVEIDSQWLEIAANRLRQGVLDFGA